MILNDDVRKVFEKELNLVREKIILTEDNKYGCLCSFGIGCLGMTYGAFYGVHETMIAGMFISAGSLLYRCINNEKLCKLKEDEVSIEDILDDPTDFIETMKKLKK